MVAFRLSLYGFDLRTSPLIIIITIIIIMIILFQEDNIFGTDGSLTYGFHLQMLACC